MEFRLQRVVRLTSFDEGRRHRPALRYWLSRPPEERLAAVEFLMGEEPVQIHMMSAISGVSWDEAWRNRVEVVVCVSLNFSPESQHLPLAPAFRPAASRNRPSYAMVRPPSTTIVWPVM